VKKQTEKQSQLSDYATLLGCPMAARMLRQIVYWYQRGEDSKPKLRIVKLDRITNKMVYWISKSHHEWFQELGLSRQNTRTALAKLEQKGIIESKVFRFGRKHIKQEGTAKESITFTCAPTKHIRLLIAQGQNHLTYKPTAGDFVHYASLANQSSQSKKAHSTTHKKPESINTKGGNQQVQMVNSNQTLTDNTANTTPSNTTAITAMANTSGSQNQGNFFSKTQEKEQNKTHTQHTGVNLTGNTFEWLAATNLECDAFPELEPLPEWQES
jgi:hypothetical protein